MCVSLCTRRYSDGAYRQNCCAHGRFSTSKIAMFVLLVTGTTSLPLRSRVHECVHGVDLKVFLACAKIRIRRFLRKLHIHAYSVGAKLMRRPIGSEEAMENDVFVVVCGKHCRCTGVETCYFERRDVDLIDACARRSVIADNLRSCVPSLVGVEYSSLQFFPRKNFRYAIIAAFRPAIIVRRG